MDHIDILYCSFEKQYFLTFVDAHWRQFYVILSNQKYVNVKRYNWLQKIAFRFLQLVNIWMRWK